MPRVIFFLSLVVGAAAAYAVSAETSHGTQPGTGDFPLVPVQTSPSLHVAQADKIAPPSGTLPAYQATPANAVPTVTFESLLDELTDLERLAQAPNPEYVTRQFSSYDRRSTDPKEATEENWFANGDRGKYLREETRPDGSKEYVLMDAEGPGAIVRIWSANPGDAGIMRVYLDGADTPALEANFAEFLGGKHPLSPEPIGHVVGSGWNSYLPIPYAKHCKVTTSQWDFYYHINYRTYAAGTPVETFSREKAEALAGKIEAVASKLRNPFDAVTPNPSPMPPANLTIYPGDSRVFAGVSAQKPVAIQTIRVKVNAKDLSDALRGVWIVITFDGAKQPQVYAPMGDFFGAIRGIHPYQGLPCGVREDGTLYSHWVMPFTQQAEVKLENHSQQEVYVEGTVTLMPFEPKGELRYFHAKSRASKNMPTRPFHDWNFILAEGRGRFVGTGLQVSNPALEWWGEGDEKIYVDGENFPSHFGTGTEDYFGYAWGSTQLFSHAYHNQPIAGLPGNYGYIYVNRFHILDDIPFTRSFRFDMEVWHWHPEVTVSYVGTVYWYAAVSSTDNFPTPNFDDFTYPDLPEIPKKEGALEAENLRCEHTSGRTWADFNREQRMNWSMGQQLVWDNYDGKAEVPVCKEGDTLKIYFPAPEDGNYEVFTVFTQRRDYAKVRMRLNGTVLGERDFYSLQFQTLPEESLGIHALKAGENNTLEFEIVGKNPEAQPKYRLGIDYIRLEKR
jgi:hypothetical protein